MRMRTGLGRMELTSRTCTYTPYKDQLYGAQNLRKISDIKTFFSFYNIWQPLCIS